jgi:alanyl-tRNA synthetase
MTTRLYYEDCEALSFDATVRVCGSAGGLFEVWLDRSAFYPTSGGQPFDTGTIGGVRVVDVVDREGDVVHVIEAPLAPGTSVACVVDGPRRRDHMEQHTGQHVLSAAFEVVCGVATVGFHMGEEVCTVDLAREVTVDEIASAEVAANDVVRENRDVVIRIVPEAEVSALSLRRATARVGDLRIVTVTGFDVSACGGTHVRRTGEIGVIAVTAWERVRGGTRLTFVCGNRAVSALRQWRHVVHEAAHLLGSPALDVPSFVARLQEVQRETQRRVKVLEDEVAGLRGAALRGSAEVIGTVRAVLATIDEHDPAMLKKTAQTVAQGDMVVVLAGRGEPTPVVALRAGAAAFDAGTFVKSAAAAFGGRGGGRAELAQGGVTAAPDAIIALARSALHAG